MCSKNRVWEVTVTDKMEEFHHSHPTNLSWYFLQNSFQFSEHTLCFYTKFRFFFIFIMEREMREGKNMGPPGPFVAANELQIYAPLYASVST